MTPSDADELRARNRAVVEAFFSSNLDNPEERIALWHPDGVKELPFAPRELPKTRWEGRDEIVANTVSNAGMFANCVHQDLEIFACEDPSLFFVTSRMVPEATFLGEPYPQSFVHLLRVEDGRIILQREYFDSGILADAERAARAKGRTPTV
ncbi:MULTISPECIES: nuclear transport factor 2 family protein [unclassified Microbacterium]|uniref:nuclear transport factor 2 family protein n=1 Tax=Microbacterium TaxID=33882 RepID=UPI003BA2EF7B